MPLNFENECSFAGPALPEPFVKLELEAELRRQDLLPKETGEEGKILLERWELLRTKLRKLVVTAGALRVQNQVIDPLVEILGYNTAEDGGEVATEEDMENGGLLLRNGDSNAKLRVWTTDLDGDLDAPEKRGLASRFSPAQKAERVLRATGEKLGLLTNGSELRVIISDPGRVSSSISMALDPHWKRSREIPDSLRLLVALASPTGIAAQPGLIEKARLQQAKVTKDLRRQAREAIEQFIQEVLDHPSNRARFGAIQDKNTLAKDLWHEGLIIIYRLLFVLKLEATDDPARTFTFAASSLWRHSFSPSAALAPFARKVLDEGAETGQLLEQGMRALFRMLEEGLQATELNAKPVGGALFAPNTTPILSEAHWGERAVACLLDRLLWTTPNKGGPRQRVHYGPLDVEDLGRVYEALLELDPGISSEPMCRLRRSKLEVVLPVEQGEKYRPKQAGVENRSEEEDAEDEDEENAKRTKVLWIEGIKPGRFYLRVGIGRKASGSFYTPHSFVRFLVKEVLGKLVERVSPLKDPNPCAILRIKLIDKAMGSGHFLVEACRFLGEQLYEAARRCDEMALELEKKAESLKLGAEGKEALLKKAAEYRRRVVDLPDPDDEMLQYLPSRAPEGHESGYSMSRAQALSRRMVAVHCIYGVDRNRLAVELAKLALWIECHAEGLPLTFLDHRLVVGDSLTGPFFEHLLKYPGSQQALDDLFTQGLKAKLTTALGDALQHVRALEATVGMTVAEIEAKQAAKNRLDRALAPFKILAAAWSGGVMLGSEGCDDTAYAALAKLIAETGKLPEDWLTAIGERASLALLRMMAKGLGLPEILTDDADTQSLIARLSAGAIPALSFDLAFPEVFYPCADSANRVGFDADLGNPPWDAVHFRSLEFLANFDLRVLSGTGGRERNAIKAALLSRPDVARYYKTEEETFESIKRSLDVLYSFQKVTIDDDLAGRQLDLFRVFLERANQTLSQWGILGQVVPGGFHVNAGAAGVRKLLLKQMTPLVLFSFLNTRKLFDISAGQTFDLVIARNSGSSSTFSVSFRLTDDAWLFRDRAASEIHYPRSLLDATGEYVVPFQVATPLDLECLLAIKDNSEAWEDFSRRQSLRIKSTPDVLHANQDSYRFEATETLTSLSSVESLQVLTERLIAVGFLPMHEKGTIDHFSDSSGNVPRYSVALARMTDKRGLVQNARFFRLLLRSAIHASEPRKAVAAVIAPGSLAAHSASIDCQAENHASWTTLFACSVANSFPFDFYASRLILLNLSLFILNKLRVPNLSSAKTFLSHSALRLTCNHAGYAPLWREQLREAWREEGRAFTWPVLLGDDARWTVRAGIDAVVAHAYGLTRDQYVHVLSTFSHTGYKEAPAMCLTRFDELTKLGIEEFCKKCDPYWNVPLNESLPKPVIDLPIPEQECQEQKDLGFGGTMEPSKRPKQARRRT